MKKFFSFIFIFCLVFNFTLYKNFSVKAEEPLKVLAIGNSYSNNTTEHVSKIAESMGLSIEASSLYFPGCTLKQHVEKYESGAADYVLFVNGKTNWEKITLKQAFESKKYDVISIMQSPMGCTDFSTYYQEKAPYLTKLYDCVKKYQPQSKIYLHETWSFCKEAQRGGDNYSQISYESNSAMQEAISECYKKASALIDNAPIIKFGKAVNLAVEEFSFSDSLNDKRTTLYNDKTSHLNNAGSYLAGCVWVETLTKRDVREADYDGLAENAYLLREAAHEAVSGKRPTVYGQFRAVKNSSGMTLLKDYREIKSDEILDIPAFINGEKVTVIAEDAYSSFAGIKEVNIPESIVRIDSSAFNNSKKNFIKAKENTAHNSERKAYSAVFSAAVILTAAVIFTLIIIKKRKGKINKKRILLLLILAIFCDTMQLSIF